VAATNSDIISTAELMLAALEGDTKHADLVMKMSVKELREHIARYNLTKTYLDSLVGSKMVADSWRAEGRQALAVHPEIVRDVSVATSDKIPCEVFRALPYINPMVVFPDPPTYLVTHGVDEQLHGRQFYASDEHVIRLLGFICYGKKIATEEQSIGQGMRVATDGRNRSITATTDADADYLGMLAIVETQDTAGRTLGVEFNTLSMPMFGMRTLEEIADELRSRFKFGSVQDQPHRDGTMPEAKAYLTSVLRTIVGTLMYLASTTLEAEKMPRKAAAKMKPTMIARKPLSFYKVGWTLGSALSRYRAAASYSDNPSQQSDLTHQQDPQHRRAHFKMQPYGPNLAFRRLTFISAYWTRREKLGLQGVNTVRKVLSPREEKQKAETIASR
jgi:hypothetical protein